MLAALRRAFQGGTLALPLGWRPQLFVNLLNRLGHKQKTRWKVRIMERDAHGRGVATYLARYLRGGALKTSRLVAFDGHQVVADYLAFRGHPGAVVRPRSTEQVASLLTLSAERGFAVVPRAAATNLCGSFLPQPDAVVIDMTSMDRIISIDEESLEAIVEPGVINDPPCYPLR